MEDINKLKKEFNSLKEELFNKEFKNLTQLKLFEKKNKKKYKRYYFLVKEIERLEWELMNPQEQEQYLEEERLSKLKREGKL